MAELRDALNTIYEIPSPEVSGIKSALLFVRERLFSFAMVLGVGFLLLVSLAINAGLAAMAGSAAARGWWSIAGRVERLFGEGSTMRGIAEEMGIGLGSVSRILKAYRPAPAQLLA